MLHKKNVNLHLTPNKLIRASQDANTYYTDILDSRGKSWKSIQLETHIVSRKDDLPGSLYTLRTYKASYSDQSRCVTTSY